MANFNIADAQNQAQTTNQREDAVLWVNVSLGEVRLPYGIPLTMTQIRKDENLTAIYESLAFQGAGSYTNPASPGITMVIPGKIREAKEGINDYISGFSAA